MLNKQTSPWLIIIVMVIVDLLFMWCGIGRAQEPTPAQSILDYESGYHAAVESGKPLFVYVRGDACPACDRMWEESLRPMLTADEFRRMVFARVSSDEQVELRKQLRVHVVPSIVMFWRSKGEWKVARLEGYQSLDRVREFVRLHRK